MTIQFINEEIMNLFKKCTLLGLLSLSAPLMATPGVYEINSACLDVGCFSGDNPATKTVEISQTSGTFRLTSNIFVNSGDPVAISVEANAQEQIITIDLNGFQILTPTLPASTVNAINVLTNNSFVTIKNGSIRGFQDGVNAVRSASVNVDSMVFRLMSDDAVQAGRGRISNSTFDCNDFGVNAVSLTGTFVGDRLYLENNDFTCIVSPDNQQPTFGMGSTNVCKDNRISYDAGSVTNFGQCLLAGTNVCNGSICSPARNSNGFEADKE